MLDIHARIHEVKKTVVRDFESTKPQPFDPIPPVARSISNNSWLICFDEFQVSNNTKSIYEHFNNQVVSYSVAWMMQC
jgi:predicted ATPase